MARGTNLSDFGDFPRTGHTNEDLSRAMLKMAEPRRGGWTRFLRIALPVSLLLSIPAAPIYAYFGLYVIPSNLAETQRMTTANYNPSIRVRYSELGAEVIRAWYNGGQQVVPVSQGITWPSKPAVDIGQKIRSMTTTGQGFDQNAINEMLSQASAAPVVADVSFVSGEQLQQEESDFPNLYLERLTYNAKVNGVLHTVTVLFRIENLDDFTKLPVLISEPSIGTAVDISSQRPADNGPLRLRTWTVDDSQKSQLVTWAKAFSADDRESLKRMTGDKSSSNVYAGIVDGGWTYVDESLRVLWSKVEDDQDTGRARLRWQIQSTRDTGLRSPETNKPIVQRIVQTQTMDVMVKGISTALLSVVSWGEAGTYSKLAAYDKAYTTDTVPPFGRTNVLNVEDADVVGEKSETTDSQPSLTDEDPFATTNQQSGSADNAQSEPQSGSTAGAN